MIPLDEPVDGRRESGGVEPAPRAVVFLSGPIETSGTPLANARAAIFIAREIRRAGFAVIVPHLGVIAGWLAPQDRAEWLADGMALLTRADVVFRISGPSEGADLECGAAARLGIPVVTSLESLTDWNRSRVLARAPAEAPSSLARLSPSSRGAAVSDPSTGTAAPLPSESA